MSHPHSLPTSAPAPTWLAESGNPKERFSREGHAHGAQFKAYRRGSFPGVRTIDNVEQQSNLLSAAATPKYSNCLDLVMAWQGGIVELDSPVPKAREVVKDFATNTRACLTWRPSRAVFSSSPLEGVTELHRRYNEARLETDDTRPSWLHLSRTFRTSAAESFSHSQKVGIGPTYGTVRRHPDRMMETIILISLESAHFSSSHTLDDSPRNQHPEIVC